MHKREPIGDSKQTIFQINIQRAESVLDWQWDLIFIIIIAICTFDFRWNYMNLVLLSFCNQSGCVSPAAIKPTTTITMAPKKKPTHRFQPNTIKTFIRIEMAWKWRMRKHNWNWKYVEWKDSIGIDYFSTCVDSEENQIIR